MKIVVQNFIRYENKYHVQNIGTNKIEKLYADVCAIKILTKAIWHIVFLMEKF